MSQPSTHLAAFQQYIRAGVQASLVRVQAAEHVVPDLDRQQAWHMLSFALHVPEVWEVTRELLLALAPKMELGGFREEWIVYLQSGIEAGKAKDDTPAVAEFELQIAILYRMLTHYDLAVEWLNSSLTHFQQLGDKNGQGRVFNEWAWLEHLRRRYIGANNYVNQALMLLAEDAPERGMSYRVQGMIAIYYGEWQQAEDYHRAALAIFEQQGDGRKVAWSMVNIGFSLRGQKRFDEAIEQLIEASTLLKQIKDNYHWSIAQVNLGVTYFYLDQIDEAISCYLNAETVGRQLHDLMRLADIATNLGLAYIKKGLNEKAVQIFYHSIQLYQQLELPSMVVNSMDGLAMSYIAQEQHDKALTVLEEALTLLPRITDLPAYKYYVQSLHLHLEEAKMGKKLSFVSQGDIA